MSLLADLTTMHLLILGEFLSTDIDKIKKKALVAEQRKEVMRLEQRFAEHTAGHDRGRSQGKSGLDR